MSGIISPEALKANLNAIETLDKESDKEVTYSAPKTEILSISDVARKHLTETRKLSAEAIEAYKIGVSAKTGAIVIPIIDETGEIVRVNFRHQTGEMLKVGDKEAKEFPEKNGKPILLGTHLAKPEHGPLVICFGTYDALALATAGIKNACSVPGGDQNTKWLDLQYDWLEQFKEIIIWSDNTAGLKPEAVQKKINWQMKIVNRLGAYRVRVVESEAKDANDLLQTAGVDTVRKAIETAKYSSHTGLVKLFESKSELDMEDTTPFGWEGLDRVTGGMPKKRLIIFSGDKAAAKTTACLNIAKSAINDGKKIFFWPGEQDLDEIKKWVDLVFAERGDIEIRRSKKTGTEYSFVKESALKTIRERYKEYFYAYDREEYETELEAVCGMDAYFKMVEMAYRRYGCEIFFLDNLTAIATNEQILNNADYFQVQAKVVMMCKTLAKKYGIAFVVCAHTKKKQTYKGAEAADSSDDVEGLKRILNLADLVLFVRRYKKEEQTGELFGVTNSIEVQKNRITGKQWDKFLFKFLTYNKNLSEICSYDEAMEEMKDVDPEYVPTRFRTSADAFDEFDEESEKFFDRVDAAKREEAAFKRKAAERARR